MMQPWEGKEFRLEGDTVLLTGATGHLGSAMAWGLARAGAMVVLGGRDEARLDPLCQELLAEGLSAESQVLDLSRDETIDTAIGDLRARHPRIAGIVNNAYSGRGGSVESARPEDFEAAYQLNVVGPFRLVMGLRDQLARGGEQRRGGASVINIASMYASVSPDPRVYDSPASVNPVFYGTAKAAMLQMSRYLACALVADGIRVNAVSPGPFPRPPCDDADAAFQVRLASRTPLGRVGQPAELAPVIVFLASAAASYINGADIPVDGGWTAW